MRLMVASYAGLKGIPTGLTKSSDHPSGVFSVGVLGFSEGRPKVSMGALKPCRGPC